MTDCCQQRRQSIYPHQLIRFHMLLVDHMTVCATASRGLGLCKDIILDKIITYVTLTSQGKALHGTQDTVKELQVYATVCKQTEIGITPNCSLRHCKASFDTS